MASPGVLILTTFYHPLVGGVETHARAFASYLRSRHRAVMVVTKRVDALPAREDVDGVPVHRIGLAGRRGPLAKWAMLPYAAAELFRLRRAYGVIYCPDPRGLGMAAVLMGRLIGRRVVFEVAAPGSLSCATWDRWLERWGIRPDGSLGAACKWLPRRLYAAADAVACLSKEIEDEARLAGVPAARVCRVAHGVDLTRFRPARTNEAREVRSRLGLPVDDRLLCLFVGRLSREKGVIEILQAWQALGPPGAILVLAGPDTPGHPLDVGERARSFASAHGLRDRVVFFGPVSDAAEILRAADLFIHPSHYEAFGLSIAEALAAGLPVVATSVAGLAEYLVHEENALLCPPEAPLELSRQLDRLLRDAGLRERLGRAARQTAERLFDPDLVFRALVDLMDPPPAGSARART